MLQRPVDEVKGLVRGIVAAWRGRARAGNPVLSATVIGQRFGNYRALSLLGEGGMGAVYLAEHPEIGRRVAIKVLRPELIKDPQLLLRFLNEARAANAIRHPNIIEILDSGTTSDGIAVSGHGVAGGRGAVRRASGGWAACPVADVMDFSYQVASALAAAHEKGIIHRDLKPDNLFIVADPSDPSRERIKVLDFGIAKLQAFPTGGGMQTRTGTLMGTPVYMSPEQCLGTKTVDARSDVYALGIIIYEMLAGAPPFLSEGFGELVNMHLNMRPPAVARARSRPFPRRCPTRLPKRWKSRQRRGSNRPPSYSMDLRAAAGRARVIRGISSSGHRVATLPAGSAALAGGSAACVLRRYHAVHRYRGTPRGDGAGGPFLRGRRLLLGRGRRGGSGGRRGLWLAPCRSCAGTAPSPLLRAAGSGAAGGGLNRRAATSSDAGPGPSHHRFPAAGRPDRRRRLGASGRYHAGGGDASIVGTIDNAAAEKAGFTPVTRAFPLEKDRTELVAPLGRQRRGVIPGPPVASGDAPPGEERASKTEEAGTPQTCCGAAAAATR